MLYLFTYFLEYKLAFDRSKRFKNKIFVNKLGPVFDFKKDDYISRNAEKKKDTPKKNMGKTTSALMEEEMHKRKIKEMNLQQNVGFSFGLKTSLNPNMKELRRQQSHNVKRQLDGFFDLENITMKTKYPKINTEMHSDNDNENNVSIRDILQEKKQNINLIKKARREKKIAKVKNNKSKIAKEISKKK